MSLHLKTNDIAMQSTLNRFNPWWRLKVAPASLVGKPREVFATLQQSLALRQMLIITGLRRVGKTTLIFQLIDRLLKSKSATPYQLLYYSFDEARFGLEEVISFYQTHVLQSELLGHERIYFFLDEIQKLPNWPEQIKILYDLHPNVKIILSGSANLAMKVGSRESLAGRFFEYAIAPLDFPEYLRFKDVEIDAEREAIFQTSLVVEFQKYLKSGGFIEALAFDEAQTVKYFKESLLERAIYRDIPEVFAVAAPDLLGRLLHILAQRPGLYLEYKNLANDLQWDQRTVANYFNYLEYSFLVQKLYNYSTNLLSSEKKLKRVYLSNPGFTFALTGELNLPLLLEQFWINCLRAKYFYRSPQKEEVDLIHAEGHAVLPIEIKIRENVTAKHADALLKFLRRFNLKDGLMISAQTETEVRNNGKSVKVLPYWKYWSIMKWLEEATKKA